MQLQRLRHRRRQLYVVAAHLSHGLQTATRSDMERIQSTRFSFRRKGSKNKDKEAREREAAVEFDYDTLSYIRSVLRARYRTGHRLIIMIVRRYPEAFLLQMQKYYNVMLKFKCKIHNLLYFKIIL